MYICFWKKLSSWKQRRSIRKHLPWQSNKIFNTATGKFIQKLNMQWINEQIINFSIIIFVPFAQLWFLLCNNAICYWISEYTIYSFCLSKRLSLSKWQYTRNRENIIRAENGDIIMWIAGAYTHKLNNIIAYLNIKKMLLTFIDWVELLLSKSKEMAQYSINKLTQIDSRTDTLFCGSYVVLISSRRIPLPSYEYNKSSGPML